ncbi:cytochrome P450 [Hygrophoropsis aurantiaca]|uniref:Cytochrome P450 n=1 Tax=Hygrophoropsis aurantiaca TaxID=72124 RepID=A0ACB7ZXY3_9AGAM|nr:cytochrome P450 [Hygrophoropsis aurantiaca]
MPLTAILAVLAAALIVSTRKKRRGPPLPPGPPPIPIVGNVTGVDTAYPYKSYAKLGKTCGDIIYTPFFSQEILVINSEKVAKELLDRRSYNYSDRPRLRTVELFGVDFNFVFFPYGPVWRQHRRLLHQVVRPEAALAYRPMQMQKGFQLIRSILTAPQEYVQHLQHHSGSIIMSSVYNYETMPHNDPFVRIIERAFNFLLVELRPEMSSVFGAFPFLNIVFSLPTWIPGITLNKKAALGREYTKDWVEVPFKYTEDTIANGAATSSFVTDSLRKIEGKDESGELRRAIKQVAATAFAAGAETTNNTLKAFVLAMVLYPEVQERAQEVIDSAVGSDRLPTFEDRSSMPYVDAVLRETLRWNPTFPLGLPHSSLEDDIYDGYLIPKGAMILPNAWAMSHDESVYKDSFEFIPERFIDSNGELTDDTVQYVFGFGRRICVGRYVADASLWSAMALMLATFNFSKAKDNNGKDIEPEVKWTSGVTTHPEPFKLSITPRRPGMTVEMLDQLISASE